MTVRSHELARERGDGSRSEADDLYEGVAYRHDERAETETTFFEQDINQLAVSDNKKQRLKRMLEHQEGMWATGESSKDRRTANREEWRRRQVGIYSSLFGLTPHQKTRTIHLVRDVLDINSFGAYSSEQVILAVINVVVREDGRWIEDEDEFKDAVRGEGLTMDQTRSLRLLVKDRL